MIPQATVGVGRIGACPRHQASDTGPCYLPIRASPRMAKPGCRWRRTVRGWCFAIGATGECARFSRQSWRRRPDLNRGWRFCRPLPYHLATAPSDCRAGSRHARRGREQQEKWSGKRDSNPRLRPWQGRTLPLSYSRSRRPERIVPQRIAGSQIEKLLIRAGMATH